MLIAFMNNGLKIFMISCTQVACYSSKFSQDGSTELVDCLSDIYDSTPDLSDCFPDSEIVGDISDDSDIQEIDGPCTADSCPTNLYCVEGLCRRTCENDEDCFDSQACYFEYESQRYCNIVCNMASGIGCPLGYRCDGVRPDGYTERFSDCSWSMGSGTAYHDCTFNVELTCGVPCECAPGYNCSFGGIGIGVCMEVCQNVGERDSGCDPGRPCCTGGGPVVVNGDEYSYCIPGYSDGTCPNT